jgi:hypothetical protein
MIAPLRSLKYPPKPYRPGQNVSGTVGSSCPFPRSSSPTSLDVKIFSHFHILPFECSLRNLYRYGYEKNIFRLSGYFKPQCLSHYSSYPTTFRPALAHFCCKTITYYVDTIPASSCSQHECKARPSSENREGCIESLRGCG